MGCSVCGMWYIVEGIFVDKWCSRLGKFAMWDVRDEGCFECRMFGMWDVYNGGCWAECWECWIFEIWGIQGVGY